MTRSRWWIAGALLAIAAAGIVIGLTIQGQRAAQHTADSAAAAPNVPITEARAGDFIERVEAQGRVGPPAGSSAKIAFAQAGIVRVIDVSVGEAVRAGQTLAELDRASLGAALQAARADVQATGSSATAADAASVQSAAVRVEVAAGKLTTLESGGPAALNSRIAAQSAARQGRR